MRVLVTGGCGYIGSSVVAELLRSEGVDEVIVYDNLERGPTALLLGPRHANPSVRVRFVHADILDGYTLEKAVQACDVVCHLAAHVITPFADHDAHRFEQINHWGTAQIVQIVERSPVQAFLYLSSTAVYGDRSERSSIETSPMPTTHYGISKLRGERHVARLIDSVPRVTILRAANAYGFSPGLRLDSVVNQFVFCAHHGKRIRVLGTGEQRRPFIEVQRLGRHVARQCVDSELPSGTSNIVERNLSVLQVLDSVRALYPRTESVFTDQAMPMRNLEIEVDEGLCIELGTRPFDEDLQVLGRSFSFPPTAG